MPPTLVKLVLFESFQPKKSMFSVVLECCITQQQWLYPMQHEHVHSRTLHRSRQLCRYPTALDNFFLKPHVVQRAIICT
jgi:hypothetical protein